MTTSAPTDPFSILGVAEDASEAEIRARYLTLVRQFPPDTDPQRFAEIRTAFDAVKDPHLIATRFARPPGDDVPSWSDVLESQKRNPPRISAAFLLSLGNRSAEDSDPSPTNL